MQTVKMYQHVRNLGQLYIHAIETANVMAAHCVYKYNSHIRSIYHAEIVVVSFTHFKKI